MATDIHISKGRFRASIIAISAEGKAWLQQEMDVDLNMFEAGVASVNVEFADELAADIRKRGLEVEVT